MKKILTYILLLYTTLSYAQLQNGFYRVHNYATERMFMFMTILEKLTFPPRVQTWALYNYGKTIIVQFLTQQALFTYKKKRIICTIFIVKEQVYTKLLAIM